MVKPWKKDEKFEKLPLHQVDSCVIVEQFIKHVKKKDRKQKRCCDKYIQNVGLKYRVKVSIPAFGEICKTILAKVPSEFDRGTAFINLGFLLKAKKINFSSPNKDAYENAIKIINFDTRIEHADALRYAEAIQSGAEMFVTLESTLSENKKLQTHFGVKIKSL